MLVRDIMSTTVEAIDADAKLPEAAQIMRKSDIGFLPVIDGTEIAGVVTDRDIAIRGVLPGRDCNEISVREVMTSESERISSEALVEEAAAKMKDQQLRRLMVVGNDGACMGVISLGDLATGSEDHEMAGVALEKVSESS